jgi:hypothetical protein
MARCPAQEALLRPQGLARGLRAIAKSETAVTKVDDLRAGGVVTRPERMPSRATLLVSKPSLAAGGTLAQSGDMWTELHALHRRSWTASALAREHGLIRNGVRRELESASLRRNARREVRTALTEAELAHIARRLERCPAIRGSILHTELQEMYGYGGSDPTFIRRLGTLRPPTPADWAACWHLDARGRAPNYSPWWPSLVTAGHRHSDSPPTEHAPPLSRPVQCCADPDR